MTAVDVATGAAMAANNNNAVGAVVPPSSTKDEDAYIGALLAFEGACVGAFVDGASKSTTASNLLPPHLCRHAVHCCHVLHCCHRR